MHCHVDTPESNDTVHMQMLSVQLNVLHPEFIVSENNIEFQCSRAYIVHSVVID